MTLLMHDLERQTADDLHQQLLAAKKDATVTRTDERTLFEAWFRVACREGSPPDKLDRRKPRLSDIHRFWELVDTTDADGCWLWLGRWNSGSYPAPIFSSGGRRYQAKRFAYEIDKGEPPPEMMVVPLCGNRACVRPDHLTEQFNVRYRAPEKRRRWTLEQLLEAMRAFHRQHGRPPTLKDWDTSTEEHPNFRTLAGRFGSISGARRAAGITEDLRNAAKTHCHRGHPLEGDNLAVLPRGDRVCVTCQGIRARASHKRRKQQRRAA